MITWQPGHVYPPPVAPPHPLVDPLSSAVYVACALAVAYLTHRRPALGVAALLVLAPFDLARYAGPVTITTLKAGLLGMLVTLAFGRPDFAALRTFPVRAMLAAFAFELIAIALSAVHAQHLPDVAHEFFKNFEYLVLFVGATIAFATDPDDRPFWRALELVVGLVSLSALADYLIGAHNGIFVHGYAVPRIAGALEGPNQLSGYLGVAIPVLVARAFVHRDRVLTAAIALASVVDILTLSRAGLIGALSGVAIVFIVLRRPRAAVLWRFAGGIAFGAALLVLIASRVGLPEGYFSLHQATQSADHLGNRAELWKAAIDLWKTSPLLGVGAGNYELDLAQVGLPDVRTHANSIYLQSLAEGGLVGLVATLVMFATTIFMLARSAVRRPLVVGALGATVALALHQIGDDMFFFPKVASAYWLVTGVAVAELAARRLFEQRRAASYVAAAAVTR